MLRSNPLIALRVWLRYRSNRKILSQLNDRMLRDIGLSRSGIGYAAKTGAAPQSPRWQRRHPARRTLRRRASRRICARRKPRA